MPDEKVYTIPLRPAFRKSVTKRIPYAVRLVRGYVQRHAKAESVLLGAKLNEHLWHGSKPPRRVRVSVVKDGSVAKAELFGFAYSEFKAQPKKERAGMKEKLMARMGAKAAKKEEEEKLVEGKLEKEEKEGKKEPEEARAEPPKEEAAAKKETREEARAAPKEEAKEAKAK